MPDIKTIAQFVVAFFQASGDPVSNLKLQKLLYYIQGWHMALNDGEPAFAGTFQAWVHGPVCPDVYHQYKGYRWNPIIEEAHMPDLDVKLKAHIQEVLNEYGADSGWQLERRTHLEAPWIEARKGLPPDAESTEEITGESMTRFFKELAEK